MKDENLMLKNRIKNIERLLYLIILFIATILILLYPPKDLLAMLGPYGSLIFFILILSIFFGSYLFSSLYLLKLSVTITTDSRNDFKIFFEKNEPWFERNKKRIGYPIIILSGIFIVKYILDYDWKTILGSIILGVLILFIQDIGSKKKAKRQKKLMLKDD